MSTQRILASVAISGPLRRTFTYHVPDDLGPLQPGQRLLVQFGRARTVGFYLGEPTAAPAVKTKPIISVLDPTGFYPRELFDLCLWISDYYFANPADCLLCALPPSLKARRSVDLRWVESMPEAISAKIKPFVRPGKRLSSMTLDGLRRLGQDTVA